MLSGTLFTETILWIIEYILFLDEWFKAIIPNFFKDTVEYREKWYRTVPTKSKVFLRALLTMREKQILASVIEIQKENWG